MIIYSVEIEIHENSSKEWLEWMKNTHIPDVMNTKLFVDFYFLKNINKENSYIIQYRLENHDNLMEYERQFAKKLQEEHSEKFKNKFEARRSIFIKKDN